MFDQSFGTGFGTLDLVGAPQVLRDQSGMANLSTSSIYAGDQSGLHPINLNEASHHDLNVLDLGNFDNFQTNNNDFQNISLHDNNFQTTTNNNNFQTTTNNNDFQVLRDAPSIDLSFGQFDASGVNALDPNVGDFDNTSLLDPQTKKQSQQHQIETMQFIDQIVGGETTTTTTTSSTTSQQRRKRTRQPRKMRSSQIVGAATMLSDQEIEQWMTNTGGITKTFDPITTTAPPAGKRQKLVETTDLPVERRFHFPSFSDPSHQHHQVVSDALVDVFQKTTMTTKPTDTRYSDNLNQEVVPDQPQATDDQQFNTQFDQFNTQFDQFNNDQGLDFNDTNLNLNATGDLTDTTAALDDTAQSTVDTRDQHGFTKYTLGVHQILKTKFEETSQQTLHFDDLTQQAQRKTVAATFLELLVLKTSGFIDLHQEQPFDDIAIQQTDTFYNLNATTSSTTTTTTSVH